MFLQVCLQKAKVSLTHALKKRKESAEAKKVKLAAAARRLGNVARITAQRKN
jgi:hypothetical protein